MFALRYGTLAVLLLLVVQINGSNNRAGVCLPRANEYNGITDLNRLNDFSTSGPLTTNCGWLAMNAMKACNTPGKSPSGACDEVECCAAVCNLNGNGCFCTATSINNLFFGSDALPISNNMVKLLAAMQKTSCPIGTLYSKGLSTCPKGSWETFAASSSNSASCKASTPKPESSSCTKTLAPQRSANLLQMLKLVNIADGTAPGFNAATESLKKVFTTKGQMMNRLGTPRTGPMNVANNFIKPKLKAVAGYTAVQSSIKLKMSTLSSSGRSMSANFTIIANDLDGQPQKYGPYHAFAVFTSCSAVLESLYVSNMLNSQDIKSLITPAFSILNFLPNKTTTSIQPPLRKLLQAVNSTEPLNSTAPLDSLQPRQGQVLGKISQAVFGSWVMKGINSIIQSPQVQTYPYQYTSGCQDSTIGNMQFCSAVSTSGSENLATTPDFESACNYLCADGAWDDVADWACDTGCYAACYGCQSCNEMAGWIGYSCGSCGSSCSYCGCNAQCSDSCEQSLGEIDINYSVNVDNFQGAQSTYFNDVIGSIIYAEESKEIPAGPNWYEASITNPIIQTSLNGYFTGFNSSVSFKATSDPNTFNLPSLSKTIPIDSANSVIYVSDSLWTITHDCSFTFRYPLPGPAPVPMPQRAALQPFVWNVSGSGNLSLSLIKLQVSYGWIPPDLFYDGMSSNTTNSTTGSSFNGTKLWDPTYSEDIDIDLSNNFAIGGNTLMNSAVSSTLTNIISKAVAGMDLGSLPCCNYRTDDGNCPTQLPMPPTQPY